MFCYEGLRRRIGGRLRRLGAATTWWNAVLLTATGPVSGAVPVIAVIDAVPCGVV